MLAQPQFHEAFHDAGLYSLLTGGFQERRQVLAELSAFAFQSICTSRAKVRTRIFIHIFIALMKSANIQKVTIPNKLWSARVVIPQMINSCPVIHVKPSQEFSQI